MTKNILLALVTILTAGAVQAQSLTKEEYNALDLEKISSVECRMESGGRIHFYTSDKGNTYELAYSKNSSKPRVIVKEANCRPEGRRWDLSCKNRNGEKLFHVDVTGIYIHRVDGSEGYDHTISFSANRRNMKSNPRENLDSFLTERSTLSKCKISQM